MSVLQQSMIGVHNAPACWAVLFFNPTHRPRKAWPWSLDRHGPEPVPFVRPVLDLINPSHDQLAIKGREVRPAPPPCIRPGVAGQHPAHMRRLRHAHVGSSTALSLASSSSMAVPLGCVKDHLPDREVQVQDRDRIRAVTIPSYLFLFNLDRSSGSPS
jgi:hypothetical protein